MNSRLSLAALLACLVTAPTQAQTDPDNDPNHPILKDVVRIQKEVEKLRGLKFQAPVKAGVWKPERLKKMLLKDFDKEAPAEKVADEGKVLKLFGLLPQGFDYRKEMLTFLTNQIGGFYQPDKKVLFLVDRSGESGGGMGGPQAQAMNDKMVMAHELHHALQDQNFALDRWFELLGEHSDRVQGYKGLVEGEAQLIGMTYLMGSMGRGGQPDMANMNRMNKMMMKMSPQGRKLSKIPKFLIDNMMFPYTEGAEFVQALYRKKGWKGLSAAFLNPPASTEQVLHLEKYLTRDEPQEIRLPKGLGNVLGEKTRQLKTDTLGEYSTMILLRGLGIPERTAKKAAAGWDGDRYVGYETPDKTVVLVWLSTWDSELEATEFEATYRQALKAKHPEAVLVRRGSEVLMVEGAPVKVRSKLIDKAFRSVLIEEIWRPTKGLTAKPPLSDFVKGAQPKVVERSAPTTPTPATASKSGRLNRLDDIGVAFIPPAGFVLGQEPITELSGQFKTAYFAGPKGQHLRVIQLPFPYTAASKQIEALIQQGTQTVTVVEKTEVTVQGRKAMRVVFTAILPGDTEVSRNVTLVVGMGPASVVLGLSQPKTTKATQAIRTLQSITDSLWLDRAGNSAKTKGFGQANLTVGKYRLKVPSVLSKVSSGAKGPIVHSQEDAQGAKVQVVVLPSQGSVEDYGSSLEAQLPHLPGSPHLHAAGVVVRSGRPVHEIEFQRGDRRYRQLTVVRGGRRWTISVSAPSTSFDTYRNAFGQVLSGFQLEKAVKKREVF